MARTPIRETVTWCVDGREVPARRDWRCSESSIGGYDQATIYVPRSYLRFIDQGSVLQAWRSSGRGLWLGSMAGPPKIRQGVAKLEAQGPWYEAVNAFISANYQSRLYSQWNPRDSEPHLLQANDPAFTLDNTEGGLQFFVDQGQDITAGDSAGYGRWTPGQDITRLTFKIVVTGGGGNNDAGDYQYRLAVYTGPSTQTVADEADWNVVNGNVIDYTLTHSGDMVVLMLRRTTAGTVTTNKSLRTKLVLLAVNGYAVGDTMFTSEIITDLGSRIGFDTSLGIKGSGVNALPFAWQSDPTDGKDSGAADALAYLASLDGSPAAGGIPAVGWRVLVHEPYYPGYVGGLRYGPFGDPYIEPSRSWIVSLEREADEQLDDVQVANEALVPWDLVPGVPQQTIVHASPDPLAYTALLRPDGSVQTVQKRVDKLADQQTNDNLAKAVANAVLAKVSQRRVQGTVPVYELVGATGPVSHLEGKAGDLLTLRDYETVTGVRPGPQEIVYVDRSEDHSEMSVTEDFDPAGMLANYANTRARRT